jgi:carbon-monoxide dehydrogenase medium subunit
MTAPTPAYHAPGMLDELAAVLAREEAPAVVSGGTVLVPQLAKGTRQPTAIIDLRALPDANRVRCDATATLLGPAVTYTTLLHDDGSPPLLRRIASGITGGPQIRNQGTVAGAACYANPASDLPAGLVALDATILIAGPAGLRTLAATPFFLGAYRTAIAANEAVIGVQVPTRPPARAGYHKIKRSESSWPIVVAAAVIPRTGAATVTLGGVATTPVTVTLDGDAMSGAALRAVVRDTLDAADIDWYHDELADTAYRKRVAGVAASRAMDEALLNPGTQR